MRVLEILQLCHENHISVALNGASPKNTSLKVIAKDRAIPKNIKDLLIRHKADVIEFLSGLENGKDGAELRAHRHRRHSQLSYPQQRLWFFDRFIGPNAVYNTQLALRLRGPIDIRVLYRCLNEIVARHDALRTRFEQIDDSVFQVVDLAEPPLAVETVRDEMELRRICAAERQLPFDLSKDKLCRIRVLANAENGEHALLVTLHHSISDGRSRSIFLRELVILYEAFLKDEASPLTPLSIQYADYAEWQRTWLNDERLSQHLSYWREQLSGLPPLLTLPTDRPRPLQRTFAGNALSIEVSKTLSEQLRELSRTQGVTLFSTLLSAFYILLHRYSGQLDIAVGIPIANRTRRETEDMIGSFANTLVMRGDLSGDPNLSDLLGQTQATALKNYAHQDMPFEVLVEAINPERDVSSSPLFQVMFGMQEAPAQSARAADIEVTPLTFEPLDSVERGDAGGVSHFDLILSVELSEHGMKVDAEYSTDLFDRRTIEQLLAHYQTLLAVLGKSLNARVSQIEFLSAAEKHQQLVEWNSNRAEDSGDACVHTLLEERARVTPEKIAIFTDVLGLSYAELNSRANRLAHYLVERGVVPEDRVGLCVERSVERVIALLAILKAGACYVPLDPEHPLARLQYLIDDSGVGFIVTQGGTQTLEGFSQALDTMSRESPGRRKVTCLDLDHAENGWASSCRTDDPDVSVDPLNLACLIYTSGDTGVPKGLAVCHRSWVNLAKAQIDHSGTGENGFDASAFELRMMLGGEAALFIDADEAISTEAGIRWSSGRRSFNANERSYVLGAEGQLLPAGAVGELFISGACLARGYFNRAGLTADRFIPNPFSEIPGDRLYRTGVPVRYLADGNLQRVERANESPRLQDLRQKISECERALSQHDAVKTLLFRVVHEGSAEQRVLCYVVLRESAPPRTEPEAWSIEFRRYLKRQSKPHLIPSAFIALGALPLTANGKVDLQALPASDPANEPARYIAPEGVTEELLAGLWCDVLKVGRVGQGDNFFSLGGHSLLATQLISRIRDAFGVELLVRTLFEQQTLQTLARTVEQAAQGEQPASLPMTAIPRDQPLLLSYAQQRLWFLHQYMGPNAVYNMPLGFRLSGDVDPAALLRSLEAIVNRHEALRTRFEEREGRAVQVIDPTSSDMRVERVLDNAQLHEICEHERRYPFDLSRDPLCRIRVLSDPKDDSYVLLLTLHHSVADGWSLGIFFRELGSLYSAFRAGAPSELAPLPIQYADYAHWQRQWLSGDVLERQLSYWRDQLSGLPPLLALPTDRPRPVQQSYHGSKRPVHLPKGLSEQLQRLSQAQDVTLFMTLLSAFSVLLSRYSGQTDIAIGTPIANRTRRETEGLIGFFVNTLVMRCDLSRDLTFIELLKQTCEMALQSYAHQDIPFEQLVEELNPQRSLDHSPLFQVMFALQNAPSDVMLALQDLPTEAISLTDVEVKSLSVAAAEGGVSRFDLTLSVQETPEGILGKVEFNTDLFDADTIDRFLTQYERLLTALVESPRTRMSHIEILGDAQTREQLAKWNSATANDPGGLRRLRSLRQKINECERTLSQHDAVKTLFFRVVHEGAADQRVICYVVLRESAPPRTEPEAWSNELRQYLRRQSKRHLIPSAFVLLDALPLTANGKVDLQALPVPDLASEHSLYAAPEGVTEELLAGLWCDVLKVNRVSREDNFFALGGHSLLVTQLVSRIRDAFGAELPIRTLFEQQTLQTLARAVERAGQGEQPASLPMTAIPRDQPLLLSYAQQRLWFLHQYMGPNAVYNMPLGFRLSGDVDAQALLRSLETIVSRHEALRTRFEEREGRAVQVIDPPSSALRVERVLDEAQIHEICEHERRYPFDLSRDPLCRIRLLSDPKDDSYVLLVTLHHSVADGWSLGIFFRELDALYRTFRARGPSPLSPLLIQYADYAHWQRQWLSGDVLERQLTYWRDQLSGLPPLLALPTDRPRPAEQSYNGSKRPIQLSKSLSEQLQRLSQAQGVTLFMTLLSAFSVLLSRYSGQTDVAIGTPIANRTRRETEGLIGFFVNTLVMRCDLSRDPTFIELLKQTREMALQSYAHQDIPFEQLVEELNPQRSASHSTLFQVWFVLERDLAKSMALTDLELTPLQFRSDQSSVADHQNTGASRFDMTMSLMETAAGISGHVTYNTDLFDGGTIDALVAHFVHLLEILVAAPGQRVEQIEFLSKDEKHQQLIKWNSGARFFPLEQCVHGLFETQASQNPDAPAVIFDEEQSTYAELNRRSNQLAHFLREHGAGPDRPVVLCVKPSLEMAVALLGILKSGAAYVPIDPSYPQEWLAYLLEDCGANLIVTQSGLRSTLPLQAQRTVCLDDKDVQAELDRCATLNPQIEGLTSDHLAYVIYTSGSTGRPKGVMVSHRSVCDFLLHAIADFLPAHISGAVVSTPLAFDATVGSLHVALCAGKYVELLEEGAFALDRLGDRLQDDEEALLFKVTPSHLAAVVAKGYIRQNTNARHVIVVAGEALASTAIRHWQEHLLPASQFINEYGPTEATVGATTHPIFGLVKTGSGTVPIGRPLGGTNLYVLNSQLSLQKVGSIGQLYISGVCLARGYLNRAAMTADRFIPNPFSEVAGERLYRTGDLVRYLADGNVEFIGRVDHQVKLRGFRIELGEIESVLLEHQQVREAVVLARDDGPGQERLVAYVVANQPIEHEDAAFVETLRRLVQERLPVYMVPAAIVVLDVLPLTANGKVDRQALPAPDLASEHSRYIAPNGVTEELLAGLWCDVLKVDRISRADNFFTLGGHSLLATQLVSRIRDAFGVELLIRTLFEQQTLQTLARAVEQAAQGEQPASLPMTALPRDQPMLLSYAQQRLWFLHQYMGPNAVYNMPLGFRLSGDVDSDALLQSLEAIVSRHEALRTRFEEREGRAVQVIDPTSSALRVERVLDEARLHEICEHERRYPFDLSRDSLCRIRLLSDPKDDNYVLLVTLHHSVADGWSLGILFRELSALYRAFRAGEPSALSPLPIQYADYAHWQRQWLSGDVLERQLAYWRDQLSGLPPLLALPTDRPRPVEQSYNGSKRPVHLPKELSEQLQRLSQAQGVTLFMTLLSAFAVLLSRYSGQTDVAIGTPIANRTRRETEGLIGFFVNTLVMRCDLCRDPTFIELLKKTREMALQSYAHQDIPFEQLVEELNPQRSLNHSPLFQVMFALRNTPMDSLSLENVDMQRLVLGNDALSVSRFDLTLSLAEAAEGIEGLIEYNTDLFDGETIERFIAHYTQLLSAIVARPAAKVSQLDSLPEAERKQLDAWNDTTQPYPQEMCLHELFEAQVEHTPDRTALIFGEQHLSYRALNERANQVANYLQDAGIAPDTLVGLCVERCVEMVVGILGILKSGAAYVPIDSKYPAERIRYLLQDSAASIVLSQSHLYARLPLAEQRVIFLDTDSDRQGNRNILSRQPTGNCDKRSTGVGPRSLAYVIYTSGSTGKPKGVLLEHRSAVAFMSWAKASYSREELSAVLAATTICFDLSIFELFSPWMAGGRVVLIDDMLQLIDTTELPTVSLINTVPSAISALALADKIPPTVMTVNLAGEPLRQSVVDLIYENSKTQRVRNLYGPSEYTTYTTATSLVAGCSSEPTIGQPIFNTRIYLLDEERSLAPVGAIGELHIAGAGLARAYLNNEALTAEKFLPNPFSEDPGDRLYRTGDLVRWLPDGNLEFLGRVDHQVKIRGFRIELGEIESVLLKHEQVEAAVVLAREDEPDDKRLVAYVVARVIGHGNADLVEELRDHMQRQLPGFMLPSAIVMLPALPLTLSGKVDRKALPAPDRTARVADFVRPEGPVEELLANLWCDVLNIEHVSRYDAFFALGGHSLLATQLASRIRDAFQIEMPIRMLFYRQTFVSQAQGITELKEQADALRRRTYRLGRSAELLESSSALQEGEI